MVVCLAIQLLLLDHGIKMHTNWTNCIFTWLSWFFSACVPPYITNNSYHECHILNPLQQKKVTKLDTLIAGLRDEHWPYRPQYFEVLDAQFLALYKLYIFCMEIVLMEENLKIVFYPSLALMLPHFGWSTELLSDCYSWIHVNFPVFIYLSRQKHCQWLNLSTIYLFYGNMMLITVLFLPWLFNEPFFFYNQNV